MNKKKTKSKINIKKIYKKIKETWANPRKKAGIKLLSYFILFFILILMTTIMNVVKKVHNNKEINTTITTTSENDKFIDKQKNLLNNKHSINYIINLNSNEYRINGSIENGIITGYLENNDNIKKIIVKEDNIYEIKNNIEIILETELDKNLINVNYIINLIKQSRAIIKTENNEKIYSYDLNKNKIIIYTNETNITKIEIQNINYMYILNFDN